MTATTSALRAIPGGQERVTTLGSVALLGSLVRFPTAGNDPIAPAAVDDLDAHLERYGPRPHTAGRRGDALLDELHAVGLTGRGGGHFPAAVKWRGAIAAGTDLVVANGAEGEPASAKDAALLQHRPHLVLDGLCVAAEVVGATTAVVWLHDGAVTTRRAVARAIQERLAAGLPGPTIRIESGPDHYLTGQASAVMRALRGGPALPELVRDPARPWGDGPPVLLHNVETLARVALLARTGARAMPRTSLLTVVLPSGRTVIEVADGTRVADAVALASGSTPLPSGGPQAVLLGGYGGRWIRWTDAAALPLGPDALAAHGQTLGAGVLAVLGPDRCGLVETARVISYLAASSARQCGPCLFGLDAVADLAATLAAGGLRRGDRRRLDRYLAEVRGRGACAHPDGAARLLASALDVFDDEVHAHRGRSGCRHPRVAAPLLPVPGGAR